MEADGDLILLFLRTRGEAAEGENGEQEAESVFHVSGRGEAVLDNGMRFANSEEDCVKERMKFRLPVCALLLSLVCHTASAAEDGQPEEKKPGFFSRLTRSLNPFRSKDPAEKLHGSKAPNWKKLVLNLELEPQPLKLPETRQLKVRVQLSNKTKRFVQLEFPTSQRIEVLVRNRDGKLVEQWSEDQSFANEPTLVVINPGERLEYSVSVATRDMNPGETYTIEAFFPNYEPLRTQRQIVPER